MDLVDPCEMPEIDFDASPEVDQDRVSVVHQEDLDGVHGEEDQIVLWEPGCQDGAGYHLKKALQCLEEVVDYRWMTPQPSAEA